MFAIVIDYENVWEGSGCSDLGERWKWMEKMV